MEEGQKPTAMILYIMTFCPASLKKNYIGVFNGGLVQHFVGIGMLTRFSKAC